jgi:hypothetical protein
MTVELKDGTIAQARYVRHLTTTTPRHNMGSRSRDVDEYELSDGRRIAAASDVIDGRATPVEVGTPGEYR